MQQTVDLIPIQPPPAERRFRRNAQGASEGERRTRYTLPSQLESSSPVGYRTRIPISQDEAKQAASLLALNDPTVSFPVLDQQNKPCSKSPVWGF